MGLTNEDLSDNGNSINRSESSPAPLCLADCGFFGSPQFQGYCSKCFNYLEIKNLAEQPVSHGHTSITRTASLHQAINEDSTTNNDDPFSTEAGHANENPLQFQPEKALESAINANISHRLPSMSAFSPPNAGHEAQREKFDNATDISHWSTVDKHQANDHCDFKTTATAAELPTISKADTNQEALVEEPVQKDRTRCFKCNIKLKLTDQDCACGLRFCNKHRYSDRHDCSFDYKTQQRERLQKGIPKAKPRNIKDF